MIYCNICKSPLGDPLYSAPTQQALTSLCEVRKGQVRIWSCSTCGHLRGETMPDTDAYYENDYRILLSHEDEDQIYEIQDGNIIYRTDHQVKILLNKLSIANSALLLDYGCAKASTPKRLLSQRADLQVHLFDVSDMYSEHWNRFVNPDRQAVHYTPKDWQNHFDIITSFFALEHIPEPQGSVNHVATLLKEEGVFYGIVPDTFGNVADFVVIDHVNHFTKASLYTMLKTAGFSQINIDSNAHRGALVFVARKYGVPTSGYDVGKTVARSNELANYWTKLGERIRTAENKLDNKPVAIYGSGFYGAYIAVTLQRLENVQCFLDRSPYQQGKKLFNKPIISPEQLSQEVRTLYVGLNPLIARATINQMDLLKERQIQPIFFDGDEQ